MEIYLFSKTNMSSEGLLASLCMYTIVTYCGIYSIWSYQILRFVSAFFSNFYWFFFLFYHIDSIKFSVKKRKTVAVLQEPKIINTVVSEVKMSRKTSGFTLIELMVVIIVIGIVGGIVFGGAGYIFEKQAVKQAEAEVEVLKIALEDYKENGQYPETFDFEGEMSSFILLHYMAVSYRWLGTSRA